MAGTRMARRTGSQAEMSVVSRHTAAERSSAVGLEHQPHLDIASGGIVHICVECVAQEIERQPAAHAADGKSERDGCAAEH